MDLQFHPDAKENFDEKSADLSRSVPLQSHDSSIAAPESFGIQPYVEKTLTDKDIRGINYSSQADPTGEEKARYYPANGNVLAIEGENFKRMTSLARQMQQTNTLRTKVAESTILDAIGEWLLGNKIDEIEKGLSDFVIDKCKEDIAAHTVYVPIFNLFIQAPVEIGEVVLRPIGPSDFADWEEHLRRQGYDQEHVEIWSQKWRKRMQGQAAAEMSLVAEPNHAYDLARNEAEKAIAALRIFSPAMLRINIRSHCAVRGQENEYKDFGVIVQEGEKLFDKEALKDPSGSFWKVGHTRMQRFLEAGLRDIGRLLKSDERSNFQERIANALRIYSRAAVEDDRTEKLLHIFVALESLLLRNQNEPISTNISDRMAFAIRQEPSDRREVAGSVKAAYGSRSKYLHHGERVKNPEELEEFMQFAWEFFINAVRSSDRFESKQEFIGELEEQKYA